MTKRFFIFLAALLLLAAAVTFGAAEEITYTGTIKGGSLHLRREPDSSAKVIQTYKSGTEVEILENDGEWCRVKVGKNTGYMMTQYLTIKANYPHLGWAKTEDDGSVLNLRAGAGATFPVVYKAMSGCRMELVEEAGSWYRVRLGSQFGYVEKEKLTLLSGDFEIGASLEAQEAFTVSSLASAAKEYGAAKSMIRSEGDFTYAITYPETGVAAADAKMSSWVQSALRTFEADFKQNHAGAKGSLTVEYQALNLDSRYHSVLLMAEYRADTLKTETVLAVNVDSREGKLLNPETLFSANEYRAVFCLESLAAGLYAKPTDGYSPAPDTGWLRFSVLGRDGVQVILPAGLYAPVGLGTRLLNLRYSQVADCMAVESAALKNYYRTIDPTKPMVALTFDDGPSEFTDRILKTLLRYDARATFCVVGTQATEYPDVLKREVAGGNEIACHTWSHPNLINISAARVRSQIEDVNNLVKEVTGFEVKILRPPYGKHNVTVRKICAEMDIVIARWELDSRDWSSRNTTKIYNTIMKNVKDGHIILCHDLYETTAAAMEQVIPDLLNQGYQLVTLSELFSFHKDGVTPGKVYNWVNPENRVTGE